MQSTASRQLPAGQPVAGEATGGRVKYNTDLKPRGLGEDLVITFNEHV